MILIIRTAEVFRDNVVRLVKIIAPERGKMTLSIKVFSQYLENYDRLKETLESKLFDNFLS